MTHPTGHSSNGSLDNCVEVVPHLGEPTNLDQGGAGRAIPHEDFCAQVFGKEGRYLDLPSLVRLATKDAPPSRKHGWRLSSLTARWTCSRARHTGPSAH